jgi:hypothetical protein
LHLWFGSLLNSPAPFVMMQSPWLAQWSGVVVLNPCSPGSKSLSLNIE